MKLPKTKCILGKTSSLFVIKSSERSIVQLREHVPLMNRIHHRVNLTNNKSKFSSSTFTFCDNAHFDKLLNAEYENVKRLKTGMISRQIM